MQIEKKLKEGIKVEGGLGEDHHSPTYIITPTYYIKYYNAFDVIKSYFKNN